MSIAFKTTYQADIYYALQTLNYYTSENNKMKYGSLPKGIPITSLLLLREELTKMTLHYPPYAPMPPKINGELRNYIKHFWIYPKDKVEDLLYLMRQEHWDNLHYAQFPILRLTYSDHYNSRKNAIEGPAAYMLEIYNQDEMDYVYNIVTPPTEWITNKQDYSPDLEDYQPHIFNLQSWQARLGPCYNTEDFKTFRNTVENNCRRLSTKFSFSMTPEFKGVINIMDMDKYFLPVTVQAIKDYMNCYHAGHSIEEIYNLSDKILRDVRCNLHPLEAEEAETLLERHAIDHSYQSNYGLP